MTATPTPQEAMDWLHDLMARNHTPLYGRWNGWRMAGRELVSPDGTRFTPERLRGLAWQQETSTRLNSSRALNAEKKAGQHGAKVKVVVVDLGQWQERHFGRAAG